MSRSRRPCALPLARTASHLLFVRLLEHPFRAPSSPSQPDPGNAVGRLWASPVRSSSWVFFRAAPRPARCKLSGPPTPPSRLLTLAAVQAGATVEARRNSQPCIHKCPGRDFAAGATSPIGAPRPPPPARRAGFCDLPAFWAARTACARATAAPTAGDTRGVRRRPCCDVPPPLGPCVGRGGEPRRSSRAGGAPGRRFLGCA